MLRLGNANAIVIQGLIAPKGLDCLKALISWEFENKPEQFRQRRQTTNDKTTVTLFLRAPLVAIGAQKWHFSIFCQGKRCFRFFCWMQAF